MKECKIAGDEMMRDSGSLIQNVDLAREDVLCLLVGIGGDVARGTGDDAVEAGGEVGGGIGGFGLDAVEVCYDGAFALGDGDVFVAGTFDDCEGDVLGHWGRFDVSV